MIFVLNVQSSIRCSPRAQPLWSSRFRSSIWSWCAAVIHISYSGQVSTASLHCCAVCGSWTSRMAFYWLWCLRYNAVNTFLILGPNRCTNFSNFFYFGMKLYMFETLHLCIIRSFSLYTKQWYMSYTFVGSFWQDQDVPSWSCSQAGHKTVWHIPSLCVQWKTPDDGQRNCAKHIDFHSKIKLWKLVIMVGFITRIRHDAR
jgi:hypothetical protein